MLPTSLVVILKYSKVEEGVEGVGGGHGEDVEGVERAGGGHGGGDAEGVEGAEGDMVKVVVEVLMLHTSLGVILGQSREVLEVIVKVVVRVAET